MRVSIRYIAVLELQPTRKTPPLTSGGGNDLHTPRRIDHIPTFASLNHDKNTRSTHYTPNAGIEFAQAGFVPQALTSFKTVSELERWSFRGRHRQCCHRSTVIYRESSGKAGFARVVTTNYVPNFNLLS